MKNKFPKVGVAAVVFHNGLILLGKRKGSHGAGSWCCPGGHLEFGEQIEECAVRELKEETGLVATSFRTTSWSNDLIESSHYVTFFVLIESFSGTVELLEPEKCDEWKWFSLDALPSPLFPTTESFLEKEKTSSLC